MFPGWGFATEVVYNLGPEDELRRVRSWLEPYALLVRYWRARTQICPRPKRLFAVERGHVVAQGGSWPC